MDPAKGYKKYKAITAHMPPANLDAYTVVREFIRPLQDLYFIAEQQEVPAHFVLGKP